MEQGYHLWGGSQYRTAPTAGVEGCRYQKMAGFSESAKVAERAKAAKRFYWPTR
jgi:hypothetical protein